MTESPDLPFDLTLKLFTEFYDMDAPLGDSKLEASYPPNNVDAAIAIV